MNVVNIRKSVGLLHHLRRWGESGDASHHGPKHPPLVRPCRKCNDAEAGVIISCSKLRQVLQKLRCICYRQKSLSCLTYSLIQAYCMYFVMGLLTKHDLLNWTKIHENNTKV